MCSVCLVGSSEDELRLPSVPGRARPSPAVPTPCSVSSSVGTWPQMERSSSSSTTSGEGHLRHQVISTGVAEFNTRPASFAAPGYGEGPERYSNYAPTTASSQCRPCQCRSLTRWRRRRGGQSQLPKAEFVLVASPAQNGVGFSKENTQHKQ